MKCLVRVVAGGLTVALSLGLASSMVMAKTKISILYWDPADTKKWAEAFEKKHPDIEIDCIGSGYDSYQKLLTMIAGGRTPDIMQIGEVGMPIFTYGNLLRPLDEFINRDKAFLNSFYPTVVNEFKFKGKLYALSPDIEVQGLFYNKDMFSQSGLLTPTKEWTFDDMTGAARKLRKVGADGRVERMGFAADTGWGQWLPIMWSFGGDMFDDSDSPTKSMLDGPNALKAFESIVNWINRDQVMANGVGNFENGKAAMAMNMRFAVPNYRKIKKFKWAIAPFPAGPAKRATQMFTAGYAISKSSKSPQAAWEFVKWMNSESIQKERHAKGHAVPSMKSVFKYIMEQDSLAKDEGTEAFEYMLDYIKPLPKTPKWRRVEEVINGPVSRMVKGSISPSQALASMHRDLNTVLRTK